MTPFIKQFGFSAMAALPLGWLKRQSPVNVISPFHHLVSDEPIPYIEKLYAFKNSLQFESDLDFLLRHFQPLTLQEVIMHEQQGIPYQKKGFLLCFDDGLRQAHDIAAPILLRKGVPAAFFINPAFVDNKEIFYNFKKGLVLDRLDTLNRQGRLDNILARKAILSGCNEVFSAARPPGQFPCVENTFPPDSIPRLRAAILAVNYLNRHLMDGLGFVFGLDFEAFKKKERPFMTTGEIRSLIRQGFGIGSHSIDHPLYALLSPEEQVRQTLESTAWTTTTFELPYRAFAFPHVDTNVGNAFFEQLLDGSSPPLDLILGNTTAMLEKHPRMLHRFIGENPAIPTDRMIKSVLAYSAFRKRMGKQYVIRD